MKAREEIKLPSIGFSEAAPAKAQAFPAETARQIKQIAAWHTCKSLINTNKHGQNPGFNPRKSTFIYGSFCRSFSEEGGA
jgi:hypothetical protein